MIRLSCYNEHSVCYIKNGLGRTKLNLQRLVRRLVVMTAWTGMEAMEVGLQDYKKGRESIRDGN